MKLRHALYPLQAALWSMPQPFWQLGNRVSDFRFWLHDRYGWEWV